MAASTLLASLAALAEAADRTPAWPGESWRRLGELDGLRWLVPVEYGGLVAPAVELFQRYESISTACLTTCFLLSQRDSAVRRIVASGNEELSRELLPPLARGEKFATVGIAQITTSRQHMRPAMRAVIERDVIRLDGVMPWVTGAAKADHIISGAVTEDGRQLLVALPGGTPGVHIDPPMDLMALRGSCTTQVHCDNVRLDRHWLLAGPAERVITGEATGGLTTSCLALGLAESATMYLRQEADARPELTPVAERLENRRRSLWQTLLRHAEGTGSPEEANYLRAEANLCVMQATQAALTASKGTGFVHPHPAQRWARQALFFLVWSCPKPTAEMMYECLAGE